MEFLNHLLLTDSSLMFKRTSDAAVRTLSIGGNWDYWQFDSTILAPMYAKPGNGGVGMSFSTNDQIVLTSGSGGVYVPNGPLTHLNRKSFQVIRSLPTTVNNTIDIGVFSVNNGGMTIDIRAVVSDGGFSVSKEYSIPIQFNGTSGSWQKVLPFKDTGPYGGNDWELDVNSNANDTNLRLRRSNSGGNGNCNLDIITYSNNVVTFSSSTTVTTGVIAPTVKYGPTTTIPVMPTLQQVTDAGSSTSNYLLTAGNTITGGLGYNVLGGDQALLAYNGSSVLSIRSSGSQLSAGRLNLGGGTDNSSTLQITGTATVSSNLTAGGILYAKDIFQRDGSGLNFSGQNFLFAGGPFTVLNQLIVSANTGFYVDGFVNVDPINGLLLLGDGAGDVNNTYITVNDPSAEIAINAQNTFVTGQFNLGGVFGKSYFDTSGYIHGRVGFEIYSYDGFGRTLSLRPDSSVLDTGLFIFRSGSLSLTENGGIVATNSGNTSIAVPLVLGAMSAISGESGDIIVNAKPVIFRSTLKDSQGYNKTTSYDWNWYGRRYSGTTSNPITLFTDFYNIDEAPVASSYVHTNILNDFAVFEGPVFWGDVHSYHCIWTTYIHVNRQFTVTANFGGDDQHSLYINNKLVASDSGTGAPSYTYSFTRGWHKIDAIYCEQGGGHRVVLGFNPKNYTAYIDAMTPFGPLDFNQTETISFRDGKTGFGTLNPTERVDIVGNLNVSGSLVSTSMTISGDQNITGNLTVGGIVSASNLVRTNIAATQMLSGPLAFNVSGGISPVLSSVGSETLNLAGYLIVSDGLSVNSGISAKYNIGVENSNGHFCYIIAEDDNVNSLSLGNDLHGSLLILNEDQSVFYSDGVFVNDFFAGGEAVVSGNLKISGNLYTPASTGILTLFSNFNGLSHGSIKTYNTTIGPDLSTFGSSVLFNGTSGNYIKSTADATAIQFHGGTNNTDFYLAQRTSNGQNGLVLDYGNSSASSTPRFFLDAGGRFYMNPEGIAGLDASQLDATFVLGGRGNVNVAVLRSSATNPQNFLVMQQSGGSTVARIDNSGIYYGNGSGLTALNAANISSGTISTARLGSGTANSTTFLRGDSTWQTIPNSHAQNTDTGTTASSFQIDSGNTGPRIKNITGVMTVRNAADSANAALTASAYTGDGSALTGLTKSQVGLGNVANVDTTNAANISTGTIGTARLGSGTANSTTYLRGDNTWQTIPVSNPFNQSLNTTNNVTFNSVTTNGIITSNGIVVAKIITPALITTGLNVVIGARHTIRSGIVNFKTVAETSIFVIPTGFMFLIDTMEILTLTETTPGVAPTIRFGINGSANFCFGPYITTSNAVGSRHVIENPQDGIAEGATITAGITVASTAAIHTGVFIITGQFIPTT